MLLIWHDNLVELDDVGVLQHSQQNHFSENSQGLVLLVQQVDDPLDGYLPLSGDVDSRSHDRISAFTYQLTNSVVRSNAPVGF